MSFNIFQAKPLRKGSTEAAVPLFAQPQEVFPSPSAGYIEFSELKDWPLSIREDFLQIDSQPFWEALPDGVILAGGAFKDIIRQRVPKDLDLFFETEEKFEEVLKMFVKSEQWTELYRSERAIGFARPTFRANKVELVRCRFGSIREILDSFDLNITKCGIQKTNGSYKLIMSSDFTKDISSGIVTWANSQVGADATMPLERLARHHSYGYGVSQKTLQLGFNQACNRRNCETPVIFNSSDKPEDTLTEFFTHNLLIGVDPSGFRQPGLGAVRTVESFGGDHLLSDDLIHTCGHLFADNDLSEKRVLAFDALATTAFNNFYKLQEDKPVLDYQSVFGKSYGVIINDSLDLLDNLSGLTAEEKRMFLILLSSSTLISAYSFNGSWLVLNGIYKKCGEDVSLFREVLTSLYNCAEQSLAYSEWSKVFNDPNIDLNDFMAEWFIIANRSSTAPATRDVVAERTAARFRFTGETPKSQFNDLF